MKTPYPHILSCIAVSILTACGGGGGGGGTPSVAPTPTYPIVQPGNIPNPSGQTERTATSPAGNQADANNALEASEENIHKEVENSVNSTQTSSENQNRDVKADSNDKAEAERKVAEKAAKAKAEEERKQIGGRNNVINPILAGNGEYIKSTTKHEQNIKVNVQTSKEFTTTKDVASTQYNANEVATDALENGKHKELPKTGELVSVLGFYGLALLGGVAKLKKRDEQ